MEKKGIGNQKEFLPLPGNRLLFPIGPKILSRLRTVGTNRSHREIRRKKEGKKRIDEKVRETKRVKKYQNDKKAYLLIGIETE